MYKRLSLRSGRAIKDFSGKNTAYTSYNRYRRLQRNCRKESPEKNAPRKNH